MALQIVPASTDYGDAYIPPDITLDITESDGLEFEGESNLYDSSDNLIRQDKFKGESSLQFTVPLIDIWSDMKDGGYKVDIEVSAEVPVPPTPIANIPSQSGTLTYNGSYQIPTFTNYNPEQLQINGTDTAVDAGTYTVTFTPKEGYCWADGSVGAVSVQWKINKANNPMTLSDYTYSIEEKKQYVFTIAIYNKQGNVTYTNKDGVMVNLTGNTLRFTVNGSLLTKNIVIPITDEGNSNYNSITRNFTIINAIPDEKIGVHLISSAISDSTVRSHYIWNRTDYLSISTLPYSLGHCGRGLLYNNEIHILGGGIIKEDFKKHYKFNGEEWISVSTLPYSFDGGAATVYNNEIHLLGGFTIPTENGYLAHYKWNGDTWERLENLPFICGYNRAKAIVYHDAIHLMNGYVDGRYGGYYLHYKYQNGTWTRLNNLPYDLYSQDSQIYNTVVYKDSIYMNSAGFSGTGYLYQYNESTDTFKKGVITPNNGSMVVFDNKIHTFGGTYNGGKHYVLNNDTWEQLPNTSPSFRVPCTIVHINPKTNEPITTLPAQSNTLTFNGQTQSPTWNNYDATKLTLGGTISSVNAGTFEATFTPKDGYCWSDESTTAKTITWTINKASFEIDKSTINMNIGETTSVTMKNFPVFDGSPDVSFNATDISQNLGVVISWDNVKETDMTQCSILIKVHDSGSTYGQKQITFTSSGNGNYNTGTETVDVIVAQSTQPQVISKLPVQTGLYTISGRIQGPVWDVTDANIATVAANTAGTNTGGLRIMSGTSATSNAGTYTIYWKPQDGYTWWDGSTTSKSSTWTITSAQEL